MIKVVVVQDQDSHWYVIPAEMKDEFYSMEEKGEADEWDSFNSKFGHYATGGDINLISLYSDMVNP